MIQVEGLTKTFDDREGPVLDNISFGLKTGETMAVIGPSGCGKTTLLYILAGLTTPTRGGVNGNTDRGSAGWVKTAFILQNFGLFPWKTVSDNIALALKIQGVPEKQRQQKTRELIAELGLSNLANRFPMQLSGGQQQRVAIARAMATNPDILLMDEPFSSLDALTRERLQKILLEMWQRRDMTYLIVTHSVEEAVFLGQYILVLSDRPTRVRRIITNPGFGSQGYRLQDQYFQQVKQVRQVMEQTG
jgi:ABC-type nitrate/sulfonate/bicarbonate transport system ATPase subunit